MVRVTCESGCGSRNVVKNGRNSAGTQTYRCRECDRHFVRKPKKKLLSQSQKSGVRLLASSGKMAPDVIMKKYGISRATFYRIVSE